MEHEREQHLKAEGWLRRAVRVSPHPLPKGRFPRIMEQARQAGFSRETILDVVDEWLNYGYVRITDQLTQDLEVLPAGEDMLTPAPPKTDEETEKKR